MKIYNNSLSEMNFMFGQLANDLGDGMYLFCHAQFPNEYPRRIAIKVGKEDENRYYVFDYDKKLSYDNVPNEGSSIIGAALIHDVELVIEDAKQLKKRAMEMENAAI